MWNLFDIVNKSLPVFSTVHVYLMHKVKTALMGLKYICVYVAV